MSPFYFLCFINFSSKSVEENSLVFFFSEGREQVNLGKINTNVWNFYEEKTEIMA